MRLGSNLLLRDDVILCCFGGHSIGGCDTIVNRVGGSEQVRSCYWQVH